MTLFRTSIVGGFCLASLHFCWVALVVFGWAQAFLNFIFKLHMLNSPFIVQTFDPLLAAALLGVTFLIGYSYGALFYFLKKKLSS